MLAVALAAACFGLLSGRAGAQTSPATSTVGPAGPGPVDYYELTGVIDQVSAKSLITEIHNAELSGSQVLVVRIDTPGGLRVQIPPLLEAIRSSTVPVVAWVAPQGARAAGAGALIAAAADVTAMSPGSTLGPLLPVNLDTPSTAAGSGAAALAALQSAAADHQRPVSVLGDGTRPVDAATATQAGFATFEAGELGTLLQNLQNRAVNAGGRSITLQVDNPDLRFHKMPVLARLEHTADRPAVAYMLVLLGLFGLVFELYFPGIGAAGLMGGAALALGLYGFTVLPTSWLALTLVVGGVALFVPDLHMGGLGVPTVLGTVALLVGSLLLVPHVPGSLQLPWWATVLGVAGTLVYFLQVMTAALRARAARPPAGAEGLLGSIGLARTDLVPDGEVTAGGSLWRARTLGAAIAEGSRVRVKSVSGLVLLVEPVGLEDLAEELPPPG